MSAFLIASPPARGSVTQPAVTLALQSFNGTIAWGIQPATFTCVYVASVGTPAPVTTGALMRANIGPHTFYGICKTDTPEASTGGNRRTLVFHDLREYLAWDSVFCAFNMPDVRIVDGQRRKRYWHVYPFGPGMGFEKVFSDAPLTAREICNELFNAPTVYTNWGALWHDDMNTTPVFGLDFLGGRTLAAALAEVGERLGLVLGIRPHTAYLLEWVRKGESGELPDFPVQANNRRLGITLTSNPGLYYIRGERNVYQVMDVPMTPDWNRAWEAFYTFEEFADDIYRRGTDPKSGVKFTAIAGDPEHYIGRQLAFARAAEITVRQYVALRNAETPGSGDVFSDVRKYHGRSRLDMPVALYLRTLLFRAFRPALTSFLNWDGSAVYLDSVDLTDRLLTDVWHDPNTGKMYFDHTVPLDGNGYAIVNGYRVGEDLFRTLRPDQFQIDVFANSKKVWQHTPYTIDDSGEGVRFILFDEPVITTDDLFVKVNGQTVINAQATLQVPEVKAALVFEAEPFLEEYGEGDRYATEVVSGLYREAVLSGGQFSEVRFADGRTASQWASLIANSLLLRQRVYFEGGYKVPGIVGTHLNDMIDRVAVVYGPTEGYYEVVDWTNERSSNAFTPEREFDRALRTQHLLPGQEDLRVQANQARTVAQALRQNPGLRQGLGDLIGGRVGPAEPTKVVCLNAPEGSAWLPAGTILRKAPTTIGSTTPNTNTVPVLPKDATASHNIFEGVTLRQNEDPTQPLRAQAQGTVLARVKGPVSALDTVGLSNGPVSASDDGNYFVGGSTVPVGQALQTVPANTVQLVPVRIGVSSGGGQATWV